MVKEKQNYIKIKYSLIGKEDNCSKINNYKIHNKQNYGNFIVSLSSNILNVKYSKYKS